MSDPDERVSIPLDPESALRGLMKVDPDAGCHLEGCDGEIKPGVGLGGPGKNEPHRQKGVCKKCGADHRRVAEMTAQGIRPLGPWTLSQQQK